MLTSHTATKNDTTTQTKHNKPWRQWPRPRAPIITSYIANYWRRIFLIYASANNKRYVMVGAGVSSLVQSFVRAAAKTDYLYRLSIIPTPTLIDATQHSTPHGKTPRSLGQIGRCQTLTGRRPSIQIGRVENQGHGGVECVETERSAVRRLLLIWKKSWSWSRVRRIDGWIISLRVRII